MKDIFQDYMSKRIAEADISEIKTKPGPIITISRTAGCSAQRISKSLAEKINKTQNQHRWHVISKEVLKESAAALQLHPKKIKSIFKISDRTVMDDIVQAFVSKDYHLEHKMRKTVVQTIRQFAIQGHTIILGRAANVICADIENALHIKIDAPLDWRINKIMHSKNFTRDEAIKCINKIETNRRNFRKTIKGSNVKCEDYDLIINQSTCDINFSVELIYQAICLKGLLY